MPIGMMAPVPLLAASGCSRIGQPTFAARQAVTQMRRKQALLDRYEAGGIRPKAVVEPR